MNKVFKFILLLWSATTVLCLSDLNEDNHNNGAVTNLMENLADHTAAVTNELLTDLLTKTETTSTTLVNNIETVVTSALYQLSQVFEEFQKNVSSSQCQPFVGLDQLNQQINYNLSKCTLNVQEILNTFQQDAMEFKVTLEKSIKETIDLPKKCQNSNNGTDFSSMVNCYIDNIAKFDQEVANVLKNASETVIYTRQLGEKALQEGRMCSNEVIATTKDAYNKFLTKCSKLLEQ